MDANLKASVTSDIGEVAEAVSSVAQMNEKRNEVNNTPEVQAGVDAKKIATAEEKIKNDLKTNNTEELEKDIAAS